VWLCDDEGMARPKVPLLTRDGVVRAAIAIVDDSGLRGLTVSRLASRMGVHHASLYHHYASKDAILDEVIRLILPDVVEPEPDEDLLEWMVRNALTYRRMLVEHPNMLPLMARRPHRSTMSVYQFVTKRLMGLGMTKAKAESILEAYEALILGYSFMDTDGLAPSKPTAVLRRFECALRALLGTLIDAAACSSKELVAKRS
jgi:AcrR family transcriptional regulator